MRTNDGKKCIPVIGRTKDALIIQHPLDGTLTFVTFKEMEGMLTVTPDGKYIIADEHGRLSKMCDFIMTTAEQSPELMGVINGMYNPSDESLPAFRNLRDSFLEKFTDSNLTEFLAILIALCGAAGTLRKFREMVN